MKKTNFTFFSTMSEAKGFIKSLSLLSMILAFLVGPIAELSALDNPFLPPLKQKDRLVEELNADISSRQAQLKSLSNFETAAEVLANQDQIKKIGDELGFYEFFMEVVNSHPNRDVTGVLEMINIMLAQPTAPNGEGRTSISLQDAQRIIQNFNNGIFAQGLDQFVDYAKQ